MFYLINLRFKGVLVPLRKEKMPTGDRHFRSFDEQTDENSGPGRVDCVVILIKFASGWGSVLIWQFTLNLVPIPWGPFKFLSDPKG